MKDIPERIVEARKRRSHLLPALPAFWLSCLLALWLSCYLVPCRSEIVDRVVAVVNGEPITLSIVEDAMNAIWVDPQNIPDSQQAALDRLIDHKLKLQEARRWGADLIVSEEVLSLEVAKIASRFASPEEVSRTLLRQGIYQSDLEERLIEEIMVEKMIDRKFRLFVEVTDIEASEYFEQHRENFVIPETVLLFEAFFPLPPDADEESKAVVEKEAKAALRKLKSGASFSEYVSEEGMTDYVSVGQQKIVSSFRRLIPVVATAVTELEINEISDLIETPAGYSIVKLRDRRPERQAFFSDVKAEIKELLLQERTGTELNDWLKEQRKMADIRTLAKLEE